MRWPGLSDLLRTMNGAAGICGEDAFFLLALAASANDSPPMARRHRLYLPSTPQHVVKRGNNRAPCFRSADDHRHFLRWLTEAAIRCECLVHSYVLMTNHVHLLVTGSAAESIPSMMQSLGTRFARYVNWRYGRSGTLWEGRYHASLIDTETYLLRCMRYIEANPVRASMVDSPGAYPWSSFRCNALGVPDELITPHAVYQGLGDRRETRLSAYTRLFEQPLSADELACIRDATQGGLPAGSDAFRQDVASRLGIEVMPHIRTLPFAQAPRTKHGNAKDTGV
jgi:putative transposase